MKQQLFIVYLLCLLCGVFSERTILFNITSRDKLYDNHYKETLNIDIPLLCTLECIADVATPCISFAYDAVEHVCYLYKRLLIGITYREKLGIITYTPVFDDVVNGKPTSQGDTYDQDEEEYGSHRAIDGDPDTYMLTRSESTKWWCVDLLQIYSMRLIQIVNRKDYANRMQGFRLSFGMTGNCNKAGLDESIDCYQEPGTEKTHYDITKCNQDTNPTDLRARVIFISQHNQYDIYLNFAELNIFLDFDDSSNCNLIN